MNTPQQHKSSTRKDVRLLSDQELRETILRMFHNWCWISGDSDEKCYYDELLVEAEQRKLTHRLEREV